MSGEERRAEKISFTIQQASVNDAPEIQNLLYAANLPVYPNASLGITKEDVHAHFAESFSPKEIGKLEEALAEPPEGTFTLIAKKGDRVVGFCTAYSGKTLNYIHLLFITPEYQKQGAGRELLEGALGRLNPRFPTYLSVVSHNQNAIDFYERIGFTRPHIPVPSNRAPLVNGKHIPAEWMVYPPKDSPGEVREI